MMNERYIGKVMFEGYKTFDTLAEAEEFKKELGDRFISLTKCEYPDMGICKKIEFYVVEYDTPTVKLERR